MDMAELLKKKLITFIEKLGIANYSFTPRLSVIVDGNVKISKENFGGAVKKLPIVFEEVTGYFDASDIGLESLHGFPTKVGGAFIDVSQNPLRSLQGLNVTFTAKNLAKRKSQALYVCQCQNLTSIACSVRWSPTMPFHFHCDHATSLPSLEGGPSGEIAFYDVSGCTSLVTTKGLENSRIKELSLTGNSKLTSLDYPPAEIINGISITGTGMSKEEAQRIKKLYKGVSVMR